MKTASSRPKKDGFVLVLVLGIILVLAALLFEFNHDSLLYLRRTEKLKKQQQSLNCASAGLNIAIAAIGAKPDICVGGAPEGAFSAEHIFDVCGGQCKVTISEENGRLNVNFLKNKNGTLNRTAIDQMLNILDITNRNNEQDLRIGYGLVPALIDWVDGDDDVTELPFIRDESVGAESAYYKGLSAGYQCENRPFHSIEQLLLVRQITPEVFEALRDTVTVYGDGKININTAPRIVIQSFSPEISETLAELIIRYRTLQPFESLAQVRDVPGMTDAVYYAIQRAATTNPSDRFYRISAAGAVDESTCTVTAVVHRNTRTNKIELLYYRELS